jgi:hypothetical protein
VEAALKKGAVFHGFTADRWTLPRVATVIERLTEAGLGCWPGASRTVTAPRVGWSSSKLCADHMDEAVTAFRRGLQRARRWRKLSFAFLSHAGLLF